MATEDKPLREIPYCTIILVVGALTFHTMVWHGNVLTSRAMSNLGDSTNGWSNVGINLGSTLEDELDTAMSQVSDILSQSIGMVMEAQSMMDEVLAAVGNTTDLNDAQQADPNNREPDSSITSMLQTKLVMYSGTDVVLQQATHGNENMIREFQFPVDANISLEETITDLVDRLVPILNNFLNTMRPALVKIGQWLLSFGDEVRNAVEMFSTTIDRVQRLFDQLMAQIGPAPENEETMVFNTFAIFDQSSSGLVRAMDLQNVSERYGITSMRGRKALELVSEYDQDGNQALDEDEFALMVHDPDIPGAMPVVMREYARRLAEVGGNVAAARMRDEIASAVVDYFTLVCIKNHTKVEWISNRLTNASLPMAFTADILQQMAMNVDDPNQDLAESTAATVINEMMLQNQDYVMETFDLMSQPEFWESEGFNPDDQPRCLERVARWISQAHGEEHMQLLDAKQARHPDWPSFTAKFASTVGRGNVHLQISRDDRASTLAAMPAAARSAVVARAKVYRSKKRAARIERHERLMSSRTSQLLFKGLLGGRTASGDEDPDALAAANSGVPAVPETLEFAQFLNNNASQNAKIFQDDCFEYSSTSSNAMNSFANQVTGMAKKLTNFLNLMEEYATPEGIDRMIQKVQEFGENGADELLEIITSHQEVSALQIAIGNDQPSSEDLIASLGGSWIQINSLLQALQSALPSVVNILKDSRTLISSVSATMDQIFSVFKDKGPPMFYQISSLYRTAWTIYYILFVILTLFMLFYGFWSSGWFGGPKPSESDDGYVRPEGCIAKCKACCSACCSCFKCCMDSNLCFWSVIIFMEIVVLLMFVVSLVLCLLAGVKAFLASGCAQIYILGDETICQGAMGLLQQFLATFQIGASIDTACTEETLLTCQLISSKMKSSVIYTTIGSLLAAVFSFQMLIEMGTLHERARWLRHIDTKTRGP